MTRKLADMSKREPAPAAEWSTRDERGSMTMLRLMTFISLHLGRPAGRIVLHGIALYFLLFAPMAGRASRGYLRRALGRNPTARDRYRHIFCYASTIHDRLYLINGRYGLFRITLEGEEAVTARLARGEGAFLLGAHLGSFEVLRAIGRRRPGLRVAMAMYEDNARKINAALAAINPELAADVIPLGRIDSMLKLRDRLDAGWFVGMLGDRALRAGEAWRVPFLGTPASFPLSAIRVAAVLGQPVIFMAALYRGGNRYHAVFEELADFSATGSAGRAAAVHAAVERYAAALERHCRSDPYNWFNFFDFWRAPVEEDPGSQRRPA